MEALAAEVAGELSFSSMLAFPGETPRTRLVNVRAIKGGFPFYGEFTADPAEAPARLQIGRAHV